jgi:hypothetical protein
MTMVVPDAMICVGFIVMVTPLAVITVAEAIEGGGVMVTPATVMTVEGGDGGSVFVVVIELVGGELTTGTGGFDGGGGWNDGGGEETMTVTGILSVAVDVTISTVAATDVDVAGVVAVLF